MATGDVSITDGTLTVHFHPGAKVERMLEKSPGLRIKHRSYFSTPKYKSYKAAHDIFKVDTDFKNRFTDYQNLFGMVKEETNNSHFTFTWGTETFTVIVKRLIAATEAGAGTMRAIHCEMEVVTT